MLVVVVVVRQQAGGGCTAGPSSRRDERLAVDPCLGTIVQKGSRCAATRMHSCAVQCTSSTAKSRCHSARVRRQQACSLLGQWIVGCRRMSLNFGHESCRAGCHDDQMMRRRSTRPGGTACTWSRARLLWSPTACPQVGRSSSVNREMLLPLSTFQARKKVRRPDGTDARHTQREDVLVPRAS